jgi:hypothetical protein
MMIHMETQIKECLIRFLGSIKASNGEAILAEMEKLDAFLEEGRGSLHPQLIHFLEKRSYAKAVMFLGGESDIPVGICGGRAGQSGSK